MTGRMTADELKVWMMRYRYSVRRLAVALGVGAASIQDWRTGRRPVPRLLPFALDGLLLRQGEPRCVYCGRPDHILDGELV